MRVDWLAVRLAPGEIPFTQGFASRFPLGFLCGLLRAQQWYRASTGTARLRFPFARVNLIPPTRFGQACARSLQSGTQN
jgi:hypothetical protein